MNERLSEVETQSNEKKRQRAFSWRSALFALGIILFGVAVLFTGSSSRTVRLLLFSLRPAHWPAWYAVVFWLILIGYWGAFRYQWGRRGIGAALLVMFVSCSHCFAPIRHWLYARLIALVHIPYESFYTPYIYAPLVNYRLTGQFSIRLLTVPLLGFVIIVFLLMVNSCTKKCKKEEKK